MTNSENFKREALTLIKETTLHVGNHKTTDSVTLSLGDKDFSQAVTTAPVLTMLRLLSVFEEMAYSSQPLLEENSNLNHVFQRKCEELATYFDSIS